MDALLNISPGVIIWTIVNFSIFALLIGKFGWKPLLNSLKEREQSIQDALSRAEEANKKAQHILQENEEKLVKSQQEMMELVREGRAQAQAQLHKALEEAEQIKKTKLSEASAEIEREKESAMQALRGEVSNLVVLATEKILKEKVDAEQDRKSVV